MNAEKHRSPSPSRRRSTRVPLADRAHDTLLSELMNGTRAPGERLNIEELSRDLNLSPTPIREALARLEHTGFVRREALRGYEVAPLLTADGIVQLMDTRLLLEPTAAAEAAKRTTETFLDELEETVRLMDKAGEASDGDAIRACWIADEKFHILICKQAGNPFMERAYQALGGQMQRFRLIGQAGKSQAQSAVSEHRQIFEALRASDAEAASKCMRAHIEGARARTLDDERAAKGLKIDASPEADRPSA